MHYYTVLVFFFLAYFTPVSSTSLELIQVYSFQWLSNTPLILEFSSSMYQRLWKVEKVLQLFSSVQSLSHVWLFTTPCTAAHQAFLSINNSLRCSNSCPSSQWCHPTISYSVFLFSSCLQSFPASGSFLMSQFFVSGGQSIGVSASASVLPMDI